MLDKVKLALRVTHEHLDTEIDGLIAAAEADLKAAGVIVEDNEKNPLVTRAVITYSKAHFGYDNPEAERFEMAYQKLKQHLMLYGDYHET